MSTFTAVVTREEDLYVATCPEVGTVSQGATVEEAVAALREATKSYLEGFKVSPGPRSIVTTFEVAETTNEPPHESDSDVILPLHKLAHRKVGDPVGFFRRPPTPELSPEEYAETGEKMRKGDRHRCNPEN